MRVQRTPRGLSQLLSIFGGETPQSLAPELRAHLNVLQLYGLTNQQRVTNSNSVLAEGGTVAIAASQDWWIIYSMHLVVVKTATMTALQLSLQLGQPAAVGTLWARSYEPFGATEAGTIADGFFFPEPRIMPPGTFGQVSMGILGTDATANVGVSMIVGVLG